MLTAVSNAAPIRSAVNVTIIMSQLRASSRAYNMKMFFVVLVTIIMSVAANGRNLGGNDLVRDCKALVNNNDHQ
jgi:hypothetical protein